MRLDDGIDEDAIGFREGGGGVERVAVGGLPQSGDERACRAIDHRRRLDFLVRLTACGYGVEPDIHVQPVLVAAVAKRHLAANRLAQIADEDFRAVHRRHFLPDAAHQFQRNRLTIKAVTPAADADEAIAFRFQHLRAELAAVRRATHRLRRRADGRALHTPYIYLVGVLRERRRGAQDKKKRQKFHSYKNKCYGSEIIHETRHFDSFHEKPHNPALSPGERHELLEKPQPAQTRRPPARSHPRPA